MAKSNIRRKLAYVAIDTERDYQDKLHGETASSGRPGNGERSIDEFLLYIGGYAQEGVVLGSKSSVPREKLDQVRKIAALCVACMEQHGAPHRE